MPLNAVLLQLAAKVESVAGTAETLAAADMIEGYNVKVSPEIEMLARELLSSSPSRYASISGGRKFSITFDVPVKGGSAAGTAPEHGKLLKACGFSETIVVSTSVTYLPENDYSDSPTLTMGVYIDGIHYKAWGCAGTFKITGRAGQIPVYSFTFTGADFSVADVALLSGAAADVAIKPVAFMSASFSMQSYSAIVQELSIDAGNTVALRPSLSAASGNLAGFVTARKPMGSFDPELVLVATHNFWGIFRAGTEGALSAVINAGGSAGQICTITAPACRYAKIEDRDRDLMKALGVDFELVRNSGNDELSIAFT